MGSVVSCHGSIAEPAGSICDQHGATPDLPSQRSQMQATLPPPSYQTPAIYTNYNLIKKTLGFFIQTKENKQVLRLLFRQDMK